MPEKPEFPMLTAPEAEVMNVIWSVGLVAVSDVVAHLPRELAYTTVMTTLRILEQKGFVEQRGKRGRAYLYAATVQKGDVTDSMTHEIANRLYGGSVKSLMLNMLSESKVAAEDLAEIKRMIEELEARS